MSRIVVKCEKCGKIGLTDDKEIIIHKVNNCNGIMHKTILKEEEFDVLCDISSDDDFLNAMIDLKEKTPIEFKLKMSQFKTQLRQQESNNSNNTNVLKCPTCSSTRVKKISTTSKVAGAAMFGLFSKTARSQFKCEQCGYKW